MWKGVILPPILVSHSSYLDPLAHLLRIVLICIVDKAAYYSQEHGALAIMPRQFIDLSPFQDRITAWVAEGRPAPVICELLQQYDVAVGRTKLQQSLREWGVSYGRTNLSQEMENELQATLVFFFHELRITDIQAVRLLALQGLHYSIETIGRRRRALGLLKRTPRGVEDEYKEWVKVILQHELDKGTPEDLGRKNLYVYMRARYNIVGRYVNKPDHCYFC